MFSKFKFYFTHSLNDLRVNKRLTFFALLAIAAGVAAIVSLQTLAVMIDDTLEGNLQETNRGDVNARVESWGNNSNRNGELVESTVSIFGDEESETFLSETGLNNIQTWIDDSEYAGQVAMTYRATTTGLIGIFMSIGDGTAITAVESGEQATQISPVVVDSEVYPFYAEPASLDGVPLAELLQSPTDIVLGQNLARDLEVGVGDRVQLNGSDAEFTVRGVVATNTEVKNPLTDIFAGLFGFYYLDVASIELFEDTELMISNLYFKLDNPEDLERFDQALSRNYRYFDTMTTEDWRDINEEIVENISLAVTVVGLVALLIGSIGIVNTMQVVVRRRTLEIAVLKTVGLQGEQVTMLFLTEAFVLGVIGSLAGIVLGWGLTFAIKGGAETAFATSIPFRIAPVPAFNGLVVGFLVTTVFGFLPTLAAGQIRPSIVLRPMMGFVPKAGKIRSFFALLLVILVLSLIAQGILGSFVLALAIVAGTFVTAGLLFVVLWLIIWIIGRLMPSFGLVDLRISLRQMLAGRGRGATTLLALVIGVFSLSIITLFVDSVLDLLNTKLAEQGNVLISAPNKDVMYRAEEVLSTVEGLDHYTVSITFDAELVRVEDVETGDSRPASQIRSMARQSDVKLNDDWLDTPQDVIERDLINIQIEARTLQVPTSFSTGQGRNLEPQDAGQPVAYISAGNPVLEAIGIGIGDRLVYDVYDSSEFGTRESREVTLEVIGIQQDESVNITFNEAAVSAPIEAIPEELNPDDVMILVTIGDEYVRDLRRALAEVPGTFALEISFLTELLNGLISTFTAFPTMVATLGLVVGGVVIANSVALTTMERRKEIAIMKAVGLQRERVLGMLLLENGLLGLVGGLIGVGIAVIALVVATELTDAPLSTIAFDTVLGLMLLCIAIALGAALSSAWGASGEKPLNVLRYE